MLYDKRWDKEIAVPVLEPWRQLLLDAADYIERHGWCQGKVQAIDGRVCAMGAMYAVTKDGDFFDIEKKLQARVGGFVSVWNDAPRQTKEKVVAVMREVAVS